MGYYYSILDFFAYKFSLFHSDVDFPSQRNASYLAMLLEKDFIRLDDH